MDKFKASFTAILGTLLSATGILFIPAVLLLISNIIDYVTGLMASPSRGQEIDSYKGIKGIKKKISMWIFVIIGGVVDILLLYASDFTTFDMSFKFVFASVTAVWLVCNETISTLENLNDIGLNLPPFLLPLIKNIKKQAEDKAIIESEDKNNDK